MGCASATGDAKQEDQAGREPQFHHATVNGGMEIRKNADRAELVANIKSDERRSRNPRARHLGVTLSPALESAAALVQFPAVLAPTPIKEALNRTEPISPILVQGWVRTRRDSKDFSFIELNDGSSLRNLQIIAQNSLSNYGAVQRLVTGASIVVRGALVASRGKGQNWEVVAEELKIVGASDESYP